MSSLSIKSKIKELGWIVFFFLILALFTLPLILLSRSYQFEVTMFHQAVIVITTSWICQRVRGGSLFGLIGRINSVAMRNLFLGLMIGAALMLVPSLFLLLGGWVFWEIQPVDVQPLLTVMASIVAGAITEEFLFRGFIFQRLLSFGVWPAQLTLAAYFLFTHMNNPELNQAVKLFAMTNIFLASILFGMTVIQTKGLLMAIGLHTGANLVQGMVLGFGVSGHTQQSLFQPIFENVPAWLTGGTFGLEGSLPGLLSVIIVIFLFQKSKFTNTSIKRV